MAFIKFVLPHYLVLVTGGLHARYKHNRFAKIKAIATEKRNQ